MPRVEIALAGRLWEKRRAGCYVHRPAGRAVKLVLLRSADGQWSANAAEARKHGTKLWRSAPVARLEVAAGLAVAWLVRPI